MGIPPRSNLFNNSVVIFTWTDVKDAMNTMSTIEVLLKLGSCLVGWMVVYTHCVWTATLRMVDCGTDGDEFWLLLLVFAPITIGATFLLSATTQLKEVHQTIKKLALPMIVLLPLAVWPVWISLQNATFHLEALCHNGSIALWHPWWAPLQLITLLVVGIKSWQAWQYTYSE